MKPEKTLVTGAGGFIGARFCERMKVEYGLAFRAAVRDPARAARLEGLGAELGVGDLLAPETLPSLLEGCDAVVHLAHPSDDADAPRATQNLVEACIAAGVRRFIHISSMSVHGPSPSADAGSEDTAKLAHWGESYCDAKVEEERVVRDAIDRRGLPAVILRPTVVFGPHSPFVLDVVRQANTGTVTLVEGGRGLCNAVFVDDVCDAIRAALVADGLVGEAFFVNGDRAITWKKFTLTFAAMARQMPTIENVTAAEVEAHWRRKPSRAERLRGKAERGLAKLPVVGSALASAPTFPKPGRVTRETVAVEFSNAKAKRLLDWRPAHDFEQAALMTRRWLELEGLVDVPTVLEEPGGMFLRKLVSRGVRTYLQLTPLKQGTDLLRRKTSPWLVARLDTGPWIRVSGVSDFEWRTFRGAKPAHAPVMERFLDLVVPGATVFDVGSNVGYYAVTAAAKVGPEGRVIAFEPNPHAARRLRENVVLNDLTNITVVEAAVSRVAGRSTLHIPAESAVSSLAPNTAASGEIDVQVSTIDDEVMNAGVDNVDVLKVDVEGAELDVLRGAEQLLTSSRPPVLVVDASPGPLRAAGTSADELRSYVESLGYRISVVELGSNEGGTAEHWVATR